MTREELLSAQVPFGYVDYGRLYRERYPLLKKAFSRFCKSSPAFARFVKKGEFYDYALFMAIKEAHGGASFDCWEKPLKYREPSALRDFAKTHGEELLFWQFVQYEAARQWRAVKAYAREKNIKIVGDMPIYAAYDSLDVWKNPELFKLDGELRPRSRACRPIISAKKGSYGATPFSITPRTNGTVSPGGRRGRRARSEITIICA